MLRQLRNLAIVGAIGIGVSGLVYAQEGGWRHDRDDDDRGNSGYAYRRGYDGAYQDGLRQGQYDRSRNLRYNDRYSGPREDRNAWRSGYQAGFNGSGYGYNGRYPQNGPYSRNYPDGGRSAYGNQAYDQGFQDGRLDGRHDSLTGHSYRPTQDGNYKHADRGYNSAFGDKNGYKQQYRSGYLNGYEQGYQGGYRGR
jgi:hypothetical protein